MPTMITQHGVREMLMISEAWQTLPLQGNYGCSKLEQLVHSGKIVAWNHIIGIHWPFNYKFGESSKLRNMVHVPLVRWHHSSECSHVLGVKKNRGCRKISWWCVVLPSLNSQLRQPLPRWYSFLNQEIGLLHSPKTVHEACQIIHIIHTDSTPYKKIVHN